MNHYALTRRLQALPAHQPRGKRRPPPPLRYNPAESVKHSGVDTPVPLPSDGPGYVDVSSVVGAEIPSRLLLIIGAAI